MPSFAPPAPPAPEGYAADAVPTAPVAATAAAPRGGRHRLRWIAALVVTLLVAGTAAGATLLLTGDSGDPDVLAWTPSDSLVYTELRLDLPGSQQAELAKLMSAFPGFDDQAAFPMKINEALDQLVGKASDGAQSWTGDIDPWFGRQLSVSVGPLPGSIEEASDARAPVPRERHRRGKGGGLGCRARGCRGSHHGDRDLQRRDHHDRHAEGRARRRDGRAAHRLRHHRTRARPR